MKIYIGENKSKSKKITFQDLLIMKLKEGGFIMDNGAWDDEDHAWVGVIQQSDKSGKPMEVTVNITFNTKEDIINGVDVYTANIVTIVDEDSSKKIV